MRMMMWMTTGAMVSKDIFSPITFELKFVVAKFSTVDAAVFLTIKQIFFFDLF